MSYPPTMAREPTQETPQGQSIPVPKRKDVLADMRKIAKARPRDDESDAGEGGAENQQGE
jgi:predicted methyltransferase